MSVSTFLILSALDREEKARQLAKTRDSRWLIAGVSAGVLIGTGALLLHDPSYLPFDEGTVRIIAGIVIATASAAILIVKNPRALYNFSLAFTLLSNKLKGLNHWNEVGNQIVLGAIPLDHQRDSLVKKVGITGVVSLVEEHELEKGAFFSPISQEEWRNSGVQTKWVKTSDFEPVNPKMLEEAADWIKDHLSQNPENKVYVHCKAGRGRSTAAVLVYLNKYHHLSVEEGWKQLKASRPQIHLNKRQLQAVHLAANETR